MIAALPVEVENVLDGPEVAGFVVVSGRIFDVVEGKFVFTGGCDGSAGVGPSALVASFTVTVCVFLATERLDASGVEALDECFGQDRLNILLGDELGKRASGSVLSSSILSSNRTLSSVCMGCLVGWTPEATPSASESVTTEL